MVSMATDRISSVIGSKLKKAREDRKLSQLQVSKVLGYSSPQFISNFERGLCAPPIDKLKVLIKLYNLSAEDMIELIMVEQERLLRKNLIGKSSGSKSSINK